LEVRGTVAGKDDGTEGEIGVQGTGEAAREDEGGFVSREGGSGLICQHFVGPFLSAGFGYPDLSRSPF